MKFLPLETLFLLLLGLSGLCLIPAQAQNLSPLILSYQIEGAIHGGTVEILNQIVAKAESEKAEAIFIQLDTPGGLLDSTEEIVKLFLNSKIPIIVYVAPRGARAGSAGTFITLSAHVAAMAPGTYIGAAHPVSLFGGKETEIDQIAKEKIENATVSFIEAIAEQRGRNKEWAKKAVLQSETLTQDKALENNVIDLIAASKEELLSAIDQKTIILPQGPKVLDTDQATIITYEPTLKQKFLNVISSPTLIYLFILGIIGGIYLELAHPGTFIPASIAGLCLIFLLIATRTLPINALGILLIALSLGLLIAEIFVTSYGLLAIGGILCFFFGSLFLFDPQKTDLKIPLTYTIGSTLALILITSIVGYSTYRSFSKKQATGKESMIGAKATAESSLHPGETGTIFLLGEYWNAKADQKIAKGEEVTVTGIEGLTLQVKPAEKHSV